MGRHRMPKRRSRAHPVPCQQCLGFCVPRAAQCIAMANTEQTEGTMKRSGIAAALSTATFVLGLPALAHATGELNKAAALDESASTQTAQSSSTTNATGSDATSAGDAKSQSNVGKKHPPTAAMDQATPPAKSASGKSTDAKHPPTAAMDSAAPQERSPGSTSTSDSSTQSGTSGT